MYGTWTRDSAAGASTLDSGGTDNAEANLNAFLYSAGWTDLSVLCFDRRHKFEQNPSEGELRSCENGKR